MAALTALLGTFACTTTARWIDVGESVELKPGEGLLALHISTNVELERLSFGLGAIVDVPTGEHIELFVAKAGNYRWTQIRLPGREQPRFRAPREDDWRFRIEPGRINYPGLLWLERTGWLRIAARTVDRSALVLESLRKRHPEILGRYPMVYTGPGENVFFEHYRAATHRARAPSPPSSAEFP